jgi:hypothetical protein
VLVCSVPDRALQGIPEVNVAETEADSLTVTGRLC